MKIYQKQEKDKQEEMSRVKEENKTETEGHSHLQREGSNQNLSGSSIDEEERILRILEEQEIPAGLGTNY